MNNTYKVSILMITYNHEKFISQAIESVLMQKTNFKYELIIGDDASTDRTPEIIMEYYNKYPEIIKPILRKKNIGANRNFADIYQRASGKYIALCEGDDYWTDPYKLQIQVDFLENNQQLVGCFHNSITVNKKGKLLSKQYFNNTNKKKYNQNETLTILQSTYHTAALVFRNLSGKEIKKYKKHINDFILDIIITKYGKLAYINKNMSAYRIHEGGIWQGKDDVEHYREILKRFLFLYRHKTFRKIDEKFIKKYIVNLSIKLLQNTQNTIDKIRYTLYILKFNNHKKDIRPLNYAIGKLFPTIIKIKDSINA